VSKRKGNTVRRKKWREGASKAWEVGKKSEGKCKQVCLTSWITVYSNTRISYTIIKKTTYWTMADSADTWGWAAVVQAYIE
jgi:hypothetical protein